MANDNTKKGDSDIFIANDVYPDPLPIFNSKFKTREEIKNDCFIVLDTNALLLPYTISKASLEEIKNTYTKLISEKRLIVPGQVAREFAKNRANKLVELYQNISAKRDNIKLPTEDDYYPLLENLDIYQQAKELENELHKKRKEYSKKVTEILEYIKQWNWNDPVSSLYADLFSREVILDIEIEQDKKEKIKDDLKRRSLHKIPPGYKDSGKADEGIGDLLIWQTILKIGEAHKKSVIFVSGEEKPDWWHRSNDQKLYPRYELVEEFRRGSEGQSFYMINLAELLKIYGATKEVVEEVKQEEKRVIINFYHGKGNQMVQKNQVKSIGYKALSAVYEWLNNQNKYQEISLNQQNFPDIIGISNEGHKIGVEVNLISSDPFHYNLLVNQWIGQFPMLEKQNFHKMMLFLVAENEENILRLQSKIRGSELDVPTKNLIIGGYLDSEGKFQPI
ncbi:PIN domain-containing protein [Microcoleus sp. MON1_C5]|uniref:PIN domain-containing protein n=1 Tax=Microcoleus sp. MON1_C5 TaxID=2818828 RepID=UPI002FD370C3